MNTEKVCTHCHNRLCLSKVPIFSSLDKEDMFKVSKFITHKEYKKGEFIFQVGDKIDSIIIVNKGSVKALKYTVEGREQILHVFMEGDFFGEKYLLNDETSDFAVEALKPVKICILRKEEFKQLLYIYPDIAVKIIGELTKRMSQLESTIKSIAVRSVDTRIGELILEYAKEYGENLDDGILINLPLTREGMANYLGIARETLSRKLKVLEEEKVIKTVSNKKVFLINQKKLKDLCAIEE